MWVCVRMTGGSTQSGERWTVVTEYSPAFKSGKAAEGRSLAQTLPPTQRAYRATQALVLMLKEAMVPVKRGVVSKSHTFMLAQASHLAFPLASKSLKPSPVKMHTPSWRRDNAVRGSCCPLAAYLPEPPHSLLKNNPALSFLLTVTSQQVTYLYSTNLPQSSMYKQRNQKRRFLRRKNMYIRDGYHPGKANFLSKRVAAYSMST